MRKIQILGMGCPKCRRLAENAKAAAQELGIEFKLEKVVDIDDITEFGVALTPALAIDGEVKSEGRIPSSEEIKRFLA